MKSDFNEVPRQPAVDHVIGSVKRQVQDSRLELVAVLLRSVPIEEALELVQPDSILHANPGQTSQIAWRQLTRFFCRCGHRVVTSIKQENHGMKMPDA